jgi:hypothetical protein
MAADLEVFVVLVEPTGLWEAGCCNDMCGYGCHTVVEDCKTKAAAAERAATAHRQHIRDLVAEQEARWAKSGRIDWASRALKAEAVVERAKALHPCDDSNPRGLWCGTCLTSWPCDTFRALSAPVPVPAGEKP